ncbi:MAG: septum formation initiator family protein [Clostridiales Family XIII bacterium]|jgi:cell division protein FtsB|nr:septum formation initiator family protein [Clostridiales Family XIII bacterium]
MCAKDVHKQEMCARDIRKGRAYKGRRGFLPFGVGVISEIMEQEESYIDNIEEAQRERREKRKQAQQRAQSSLRSRRRKLKADKVEAEKARRSFITGRRLILVCVTVSVVFFVGSSAFRIIDLKGQEKKAAEELNVKTEQKARLESELAALKDKEYIGEQARERLGMVKRGDVVYIFEDSEENALDSGK